MNADKFWLLILIMAAGTLAIRGSLVAFSSKLQISDRMKELFSYIPAAILPAFIVPSVFFHQGHVEWLHGKERLVVLVAATALCFILRSTLATIVFGLVALYLINHCTIIPST